MPCYRLLLPNLFLALLTFQGCHSNDSSKAADLTTLPPCALALAPINNSGREETRRIDSEIAQLQQAVRKGSDPKHHIEQLGWKFVEKARLSYDPGYYKIAEQCAACLEARQPNSNEAMLLRGHVLHNLHRFKEADGVARKLVSNRGLAFDYGLLGDVLMEQGKLDEAVPIYQKMMELKPGPQAYMRAAHVRWLKGDLEGSRVLMRMAAQAAGQGDPESAAWAYSRLALYELQFGATKKAVESCQAAITLQRDYAPALLACGRVMMAEGQNSMAITLFQRAAKLNPLPEYQWTLADALRADKRDNEASEIESQLNARGEADDPRTFSLYLATRGEQSEKALRLAEGEQKVRSDVFTVDALAWAQAASGQYEEAYRTIQPALATGTEDARLFLHAAVIAARTQHSNEARKYRNRANALQLLLLPSEKKLLLQLKI